LQNRQSDVDVLMPFHRLDEFLHEAVFSVLKSEKISLRLILLDNRADKSQLFPLNLFESRLEATGHTIELVVVEAPNTYADALNLGILKAEADFVALMNSDDLVASDRFYRERKILIQENADIAICKLRKFSKKRTIASMSGAPKLALYSNKYLLIGAYGADASVMFRTTWLHSGRRTFSQTQHSDWEFALRNYSGAKIVGIDEYLYFYRMHENQFTRSLESKELETEIIDLLREQFESIGMLIQNRRILLAISSPHLRIRLNKVEMQTFLQICELYRNSFITIEQRKDVTNLLARRILFTLVNPELIFVVNLRWWPPIMIQLFSILKDVSIGSLKFKTIR
jgi:hypothetical protein